MGRLRRGDAIGVRGPFGASWPVEDAAGKDVVIVAGGIGLAPLRPVIYHVLARREKYGRVSLLYGARAANPEELLPLLDARLRRGRNDRTGARAG